MQINFAHNIISERACARACVRACRIAYRGAFSIMSGATDVQRPCNGNWRFGCGGTRRRTRHRANSRQQIGRHAATLHILCVFAGCGCARPQRRSWWRRYVRQRGLPSQPAIAWRQIKWTCLRSDQHAPHVEMHLSLVAACGAHVRACERGGLNVILVQFVCKVCVPTRACGCL